LSIEDAIKYDRGLPGVSKSSHAAVRSEAIILDKLIDKFLKGNLNNFRSHTVILLKKMKPTFKSVVEYAPQWVLIMISISLGLGTMIGWKRIVVTIGEKIGKDHLTYAQGATAELIASGTIALSSFLHLPVSTTHVLSSGIAGAMVSANGSKNLQPKTVRSIATAWVLTMPVTIVLSACLFLFFRWLL
jgi:PiT family inorganic phosphate transporter